VPCRGKEFAAIAFVDGEGLAEDRSGLGGEGGGPGLGFVESGRQRSAEGRFGVADEKVGAAEAGCPGGDGGGHEFAGVFRLVQGDADALAGPVGRLFAAERFTHGDPPGGDVAVVHTGDFLDGHDHSPQSTRNRAQGRAPSAPFLAYREAEAGGVVGHLECGFGGYRDRPFHSRLGRGGREQGQDQHGADQA
jgi:hypothetical protein